MTRLGVALGLGLGEGLGELQTPERSGFRWPPVATEEVGEGGHDQVGLGLGLGLGLGPTIMPRGFIVVGVAFSDVAASCPIPPEVFDVTVVGMDAL